MLGTFIISGNLVTKFHQSKPALRGKGINMKNSLTIRGDLNQMFAQLRYLSEYGFKLKRSGVYGIINNEDIEKALRTLFLYSVDGWWHYEKEYIELGICTKEVFLKKLRLQIEGH